VVVINPEDGGSDTLISAWVYQSPLSTPVITGIEPNKGPTIGGQLVTITGDNFHKDAEVFFGTLKAERVEVPGTYYYRTITCKTPAQKEGTYDVTIKHPAPDFGQAVLNNGYAYEKIFPEPPQGFVAQVIGNRFIKLSWEPVEGVKGYEIYARNYWNDEGLFIGSTDKTSYVMEKVPDRSGYYYFQLRSVSDKGASSLVETELYVGSLYGEDYDWDSDKEDEDDEITLANRNCLIDLQGSTLLLTIGDRAYNATYLVNLDFTNEDKYSQVDKIQVNVPLWAVKNSGRLIAVKTSRYELEFNPRVLYTREFIEAEKGAVWADQVTNIAEIYGQLIIQPLENRVIEPANQKLGYNYKLVSGVELLALVQVKNRAKSIAGVLNGSVGLTLKAKLNQWSASESGSMYLYDPAKRQWGDIYGSTNPAYGTGKAQVLRSGRYALITKKTR
jgi:hypothetical protein